MRYHQLDNGDILFRQSETPPKIVPGFYQDDKDPRLWHPDFVDCKHRLKTNVKLPCGRLCLKYFCPIFNKVVDARICSNCEEEDK
jgi:hypothetical protein